MAKRLMLGILLTAGALMLVLGFVGGERGPHAAAFDIPMKAFAVENTSGAVFETTAIDTPFTMAGFSWKGASPQAAWYRTDDGSGWTEWIDLGIDLDTVPDPGTDEYARQRFATEPIYTGENNRIQFRYTGGNPSDVRAALIDTTSRTKPFVQQVLDHFTPVEANAAPQKPGIRPRSDWDPSNRCEPRRLPEEIQVTMVVVHHSGGTTRAYSASEVPGIILGYCLYHRDAREFDDLAYNYVIDRFGTTWEGRAGGIDKGIRGGHAMGFSGYSSGVMLIGNFVTRSVPSAQRAALEDFLAWKLSLHNLDPLGTSTVISKGSYKYDQGVTVTVPTINGHRDLQATACPGAYLYNQLPSIRTRVAAQWTQLQDDYYTAPAVGNFTGDGVSDGAVYRPSDGTWWVTDGASGSASSWLTTTVDETIDNAVGADLGGSRSSVVFRSGRDLSVLTAGSGTFTRSTPASLSTPTGWSDPLVFDPSGGGSDAVAFVHDNGVVEVFSSGAVSNWGTLGSSFAFTVAGDFDGDGKDDVAGFGSDGRMVVGRSTGSSLSPASQWGDASPNSGWQHVLAGDFDGDGIDDLAAFHDPGNTWYVFRSNGTAFRQPIQFTTPTEDSWTEAFVFDDGGNGTDEIIALDAYSGLWWMGRFDLPMPYFTKIEDSPFRTTLTHPDAERTGNTFLTWYGQEFSWIRSPIGYDGGLDIDDIDATMRIAGGSRYSTAVAISQSAFPDGASTVFVGTGMDFPDALTGGPAAATLDAPILLTDPTWLPDSTMAEIRRLAPDRIVVLGGPSAVSDAVYGVLSGLAPQIERVSGLTRYATAAMVAATFFPTEADVVYIATGQNFPDALAGAAAAVQDRAPVLLVLPDAIPVEIRSQLERLSPNRIILLGGTSAISTAVEQELSSGFGASVTRYAGIDRYTTAAITSQASFGSDTRVVYATTGVNFPDAVASAAASAQLDAPILLLKPESVPAATARELTRLRPEVIVILGGEAVISEEIRFELEGYGTGATSLRLIDMPRP